MAVVGVLAAADVGDDDQRRRGALDRPDRLLHDAVIGVAAGGDGVLLGRQAEEQHAGDAQAGDLLDLGGELIDRELIAARHRPDLAPHAVAVGDEQRIDEPIDRQRRLADEPAQRLGAAQAAQALKAHPTSQGGPTIRAMATSGSISLALVIDGQGRQHSARQARAGGPVPGCVGAPLWLPYSADLVRSTRCRLVGEGSHKGCPYARRPTGGP